MTELSELYLQEYGGDGVTKEDVFCKACSDIMVGAWIRAGTYRRLGDLVTTPKTIAEAAYRLTEGKTLCEVCSKIAINCWILQAAADLQESSQKRNRPPIVHQKNVRLRKRNAIRRVGK